MAGNTLIFGEQTAGISYANQGEKTLAVHCHSDVCSAAVGILQCVERPGSVYSIMPQW